MLARRRGSLLEVRGGPGGGGCGGFGGGGVGGGGGAGGRGGADSRGDIAGDIKGPTAW
eukprot:CAMPEP_0205874672 /NCGR_PEP_ID=MMETSP1083-20121108/12839_1 /ASSEMBLY_ACC=CAM_ASM_000430 /TAXON_ID=97485 /ORGANISM="Prymnesium parvum, Strain Texoma1" /LENGTH=57 /DNA_ID=CAMNT_0053237281 /DNA_START=766 /DNA_END=939 /DNA_ORIENTATION=-